MSSGVEMPGGWTMPMLLNFRQSLPGNENRNLGAPVIFAASGYFLVWQVFGAVVYLAGVMFALATMRLEWLSRMVPALSGAALMVAGAIRSEEETSELQS